MGKTYWMLATTHENYEISRARDFSVQGVEQGQRRKAVRMATDDRLLFYVSDRRAFAASATLTSDHFEDHEKIWRHHSAAEDFPHRVKLEPAVVVDESSWLDAAQIGPRMEYVRKWPPEWWHLAFVGGLHILPQRDFSLLEEELRRAAGGGRKRRRRRRRGRSQAEDSGQHDQLAPAPAD